MEFNTGDLFFVRGVGYFECTGVIHTDSIVYGCLANKNNAKQEKFNFESVTTIYRREEK